MLSLVSDSVSTRCQSFASTTAESFTSSGGWGFRSTRPASFRRPIPSSSRSLVNKVTPTLYYSFLRIVSRTTRFRVGELGERASEHNRVARALPLSGERGHTRERAVRPLLDDNID